MVSFTGGITLPEGGFKLKTSLPPTWTSTTNLGSNHESKTITESPYSLVASDPENDPLTYSFVSGTLPTGATINSNGTITGPAVSVPGSNQQFDFVARVSDGLSSIDKAFSITVNENANPTWSGGTAADLGSVEENSSINIQLTAVDADGLPMSLTYSEFGGSFPAWLNINSGGLLTGTAADVESDTEFMFTVTASDGDESADRQFSLEVTDIPEQFNAVAFDDSVYLTRGSLPGGSDSTYSLISFWFNFPAEELGNNAFIYRFSIGNSSRFDAVRLGGTKKWWFRFIGTNNVGLWMYETNARYSSTYNPGWHHVLISTFFQTSPVKTYIYIDDVAAAGTQIVAPAYSQVDIDFTTSAVQINSSWTINGGSSHAIVDVAELYITNEYLPLNTTSNRRKFITSGKKPVDLTGEGLPGALPTGNQPLIYMSGPTNTWHQNLGTGGSFSKNGTLNTATSNPND